ANDLLAVDLTNPDVTADDQVTVPRGTLYVARAKFLWQGASHERLRIRNYQRVAVTASLQFHFAADFADIFEVRGTRRSARGRHLGGVVDGASVVLAYQGLDDVIRRTRLTFAPAPTALTQADAKFNVTLPPHGEATLDMIVSCETADAPARIRSYDQAQA